MQDIPPKILHYTLDYNKLARRIKRSKFSINDVIIRPISSKDKQRYGSFIRDYFKNKSAERTNQLRIPICNAERLYYIALYKDRIVGGVGMSKVASKDTELWRIAGLSILHKLRGYGVGELLLKTIVASIKKDNITIFLSVNKNNGRAINLYKKLGFRIMDEQTRCNIYNIKCQPEKLIMFLRII